MRNVDRIKELTKRIRLLEAREGKLAASRDGFRDLYIKQEKKTMEAKAEQEEMEEAMLQIRRMTDALIAVLTLEHGKEEDESRVMDIVRLDVEEILEKHEVISERTESGVRIIVRNREKESDDEQKTVRNLGETGKEAVVD